jgi:hypothetical protein
MAISIKASCKSKRELYFTSRNTNDLRWHSHYKMYCKIQSSVIKDAKHNNHNNQILEKNNRIKIIWEIKIIIRWEKY